MTYTQRIQMLASAATLLAFTACSKAPDLSAVHVEREKPVNRSDTFQAAASNGKVLVAGTAAGVLSTGMPPKEFLYGLRRHPNGLLRIQPAR